ncbi:DUF4910 domain-containing protein [Candidatus Dependentiae bacterium]
MNKEESSVANSMYNLIKTLFPICRSITGNGVRKTLDIIKSYIPVKINEVASGTQVFDWTIPEEWNIKDAYIKNSSGKKIIDFKKSNLHVLNYSIPIHKKMSLEELKSHLFTLPEYPEWIPYLTSYYKKNWGFCLSHNQYKNLKEDSYEVCIDSELKKGFLTYGELFIKGQIEKEILFTCYLCHPSMCNDSLSGVVLLTFLAQNLLKQNLKYSYRFLFIPETIGAITWLALNENNIKKINCGLVATCVGDKGEFTYKKTKSGSAYIDKVVEKVLIDSEVNYKAVDFFPWGSDERQFSSPGFNLDFGFLMKTQYASYDEYHTSADNLSFNDANSLQHSLEQYLNIVFILEKDEKYINLNSKCEPQLGKRGLYNSIGGNKNLDDLKKAIFWLLSLSNGNTSLLDISMRSKLKFKIIFEAAELLQKHGVICEQNKELKFKRNYLNHKVV